MSEYWTDLASPMALSLRYLQSLLEYLKSFYRRAFPLKDMDSELETVIADFNKRWEKGQIEGWSEITPSSASQDAGIWCDACTYYFHTFTVSVLASQLRYSFWLDWCGC